MNCPKNITEKWRRELWEKWCNVALGETVELSDGSKVKVNYRRLSEMVRKANTLKLDKDCPVMARMDKIRDEIAPYQSYLIHLRTIFGKHPWTIKHEGD